MRPRRMTTRKTTLRELDDEFDIAFWKSVPPVERFLAALQLSEEVYSLKGEQPREPGLSRSVARVIRR